MTKRKEGRSWARVSMVLLVVGNVLGLLAFAIAWFYLDQFGGWSACSKVTYLDRGGVIDQERLNEVCPDLGGNIRYKLPMWIAEREMQSAERATKMATVLAGLNTVLTILVWRSRRSATSSDDAHQEIATDG